MQMTIKTVTWIAVVGFIFTAMGCSAVIETRGKDTKTASGDPAGGARLAPLVPQPAEGSLEPGLAVKYYKYNFRSAEKKNQNYELKHISDMPDVQTMDEKGYPGAPITRLAHRADRNVEVFNSGLGRLVCAQMRGLIHFAQTGEYKLKAEINDGIRIFLDARLIISDPQWGSDRFSSPSTLDIREPGWYPVLVRYFQRKGTSALLLYWKKPGDSEFVIIPAKAYAHLPASS
jgi:hypothetical protein